MNRKSIDEITVVHLKYLHNDAILTYYLATEVAS